MMRVVWYRQSAPQGVTTPWPQGVVGEDRIMLSRPTTGPAPVGAACAVIEPHGVVGVEYVVLGANDNGPPRDAVWQAVHGAWWPVLVTPGQRVALRWA